MPMFRKKPVVIEAVEFRGFGGDGVPLNPWPVGWNVSDWRSWPAEGPPLSLVVPTLEGDHHAIAGDWIIKGVKGEFYPCKPDVFAATYDPAPVREEPRRCQHGVEFPGCVKCRPAAVREEPPDPQERREVYANDKSAHSLNVSPAPSLPVCPVKDCALPPHPGAHRRHDGSFFAVREEPAPATPVQSIAKDKCKSCGKIDHEDGGCQIEE